jgi:hypothetical protein
LLAPSDKNPEMCLDFPVWAPTSSNMCAISQIQHWTFQLSGIRENLLESDIGLDMIWTF